MREVGLSLCQGLEPVHAAMEEYQEVAIFLISDDPFDSVCR